jgi:hypothetical protein
MIHLAFVDLCGMSCGLLVLLLLSLPHLRETTKKNSLCQKTFAKEHNMLVYMLALMSAAPIRLTDWTTSPASVLPNLNGTAYPRYSQVFESGECNRADAVPNGRQFPLPNGGGGTDIDPDKICFSCFRIPTLLAGQTPSVVHAFAEGRRGELSSPGRCPDGPDTRLVYKRSSDNGATWSALSVFLQDPSKRAENGLCQSQAAPVFDPVTNTLIVGFTASDPLSPPPPPLLLLLLPSPTPVHLGFFAICARALKYADAITLFRPTCQVAKRQL